MNTPVAGPTTTRYPVTGTPLTTTQTTASNSGYPPDPVRAPLPGEPQCDDAPLSTLRQTPGAVVRATRAVVKPVALPVAFDPFADYGWEDLEAFSDPTLGPPILDDQGYDASPSLRGQR